MDDAGENEMRRRRPLFEWLHRRKGDRLADVSGGDRGEESPADVDAHGREEEAAFWAANGGEPKVTSWPEGTWFGGGG
jgi:hypothetical protein